MSINFSPSYIANSYIQNKRDPSPVYPVNLNIPVHEIPDDELLFYAYEHIFQYVKDEGELSTHCLEIWNRIEDLNNSRIIEIIRGIHISTLAERNISILSNLTSSKKISALSYEELLRAYLRNLNVLILINSQEYASYFAKKPALIQKLEQFFSLISEELNLKPQPDFDISVESPSFLDILLESLPRIVAVTHIQCESSAKYPPSILYKNPHLFYMVIISFMKDLYSLHFCNPNPKHILNLINKILSNHFFYGALSDYSLGFLLESTFKVFMGVCGTFNYRQALSFEPEKKIDYLNLSKKTLDLILSHPDTNRIPLDYFDFESYKIIWPTSLSHEMIKLIQSHPNFQNIDEAHQQAFLNFFENKSETNP